MTTCQGCQNGIQKREVGFVDDETFAFLEALPEGVTPGAFCPSCFEERVRPALTAYQDLMAAAENVNMFYLSQSKESRFVRRTERRVQVDNCSDKQEAILRLAFKAVQIGKNALVDVDLRSRKVIAAGGYQTSLWAGVAIPADIDEAQLNRRFVGAPN